MLFANIFRALEFDHRPTLSEIIKRLDWGSNRNIRQHGFRIDFDFSDRPPFFSARVKDLPRVKDPGAKLLNGNAVLTPKGDRVVVIIINEDL